MQSASTLEKRDSSAADARRRFIDACRRNDARAARVSLLGWIGASTADKEPVSLRSFARQSGQPALTRLLQDLDRACYAGGDWQGAPLLEALNQLPAPRVDGRGPTEELQPLYK